MWRHFHNTAVLKAYRSISLQDTACQNQFCTFWSKGEQPVILYQNLPPFAIHSLGGGWWYILWSGTNWQDCFILEWHDVNLSSHLYGCIFFTPNMCHRLWIVFLPSLDKHYKSYLQDVAERFLYSYDEVYHSLVRHCNHPCKEHNIFWQW